MTYTYVLRVDLAVSSYVSCGDKMMRNGDTVFDVVDTHTHKTL